MGLREPLEEKLSLGKKVIIAQEERDCPSGHSCGIALRDTLFRWPRPCPIRSILFRFCSEQHSLTTSRAQQWTWRPASLETVLLGQLENLVFQSVPQGLEVTSASLCHSDPLSPSLRARVGCPLPLMGGQQSFSESRTWGHLVSQQLHCYQCTKGVFPGSRHWPISTCFPRLDPYPLVWPLEWQGYSCHF